MKAMRLIQHFRDSIKLLSISLMYQFFCERCNYSYTYISTKFFLQIHGSFSQRYHKGLGTSFPRYRVVGAFKEDFINREGY